MRSIRFWKMHGAGNDFIMVDGSDLTADQLSAPLIARWCHRRTGIGADGLIILQPGTATESDFRMVYFNAGGGHAEMCGNGARCSVAFARELGWIESECRFDTFVGVLTGRILGSGEVVVSLPKWRDLIRIRAVTESPWAEHHFCNTGVPHLVISVDELESVDVDRYGRQLRFDQEFAPDGTNVNWVAASAESTDEGRPIFDMRTYERGVEEETLACGTGASAVAVILCELGQADSPVAVRTRNGDLLHITVRPKDQSLLLQGPAVISFQGKVPIDE